MRKMMVMMIASVGLLLFVGVAAAKGHVVNATGITQTIACTAEESEIALNGSDLTITITGPCTKVAVNGAKSKVTIAQAEALAINGSQNTVDVDAAAKIAVTGANNKVTWKRGLDDAKKPKVSVLGAGNDVKQGK